MGSHTSLFSLVFFTMGRVRTKTVKKAARLIIEKYYQKLTLDFQTNKKITEDVAIVQSKRMRNKIAGYVTHLMKRLKRGPVHGISLKLQERERRMDFEPDVSAVDVEHIEVDPDTQAMLRSLDVPNLLTDVKVTTGYGRRDNDRKPYHDRK